MRADTNLDFESANCTEFDWCSAFAGGSSFCTQSAWRRLKLGRVLKASGGHGQWFGLPQPVDHERELAKDLHGLALTAINVDDLTGDLTLELRESNCIEIRISSSGYESYSFRLFGHEYVGGGGGEPTVVVPTPRAHEFVSCRVVGGFGTHQPPWEAAAEHAA